MRSRPHSNFWLDAGRRVSVDLSKKVAVFALDSSIQAEEIMETLMDQAESEALTEYVSNRLSLERDPEDQIVNNLDFLELGLTLVSRQETIGVGRLDMLAKDREGRLVIFELKAGEAKESALGQIARYIGWFTHRDGSTPRAILVAGGFAE
jgi:RecB family endonuclease NucS